MKYFLSIATAAIILLLLLFASCKKDQAGSSEKTQPFSISINSVTEGQVFNESDTIWLDGTFSAGPNCDYIMQVYYAGTEMMPYTDRGLISSNEQTVREYFIPEINGDADMRLFMFINNSGNSQVVSKSVSFKVKENLGPRPKISFAMSSDPAYRNGDEVLLKGVVEHGSKLVDVRYELRANGNVVLDEEAILNGTGNVSFERIYKAEVSESTAYILNVFAKDEHNVAQKRSYYFQVNP